MILLLAAMTPEILNPTVMFDKPETDWELMTYPGMWELVVSTSESSMSVIAPVVTGPRLTR